MKALLISSGSRGDFQPLLALAVALRRAGHQAIITGGITYQPEAEAFGVPFALVGMDVKTWMDDNRNRLTMTPLNGVVELLRLVSDEYRRQVAGALPLARECDVVVGAGAMLAAPTVAEAAGIPLRYIAYTPQVFRSREHAPFIFPVTRLPGFANDLLWDFARLVTERTLRSALDPVRESLRLPRVANLQHHIFPHDVGIIAADPELCPVARDLLAPVPAVGGFELADDRPLPADLEEFLAAGPAPVYVGFGSMPDNDAERTARILVDAARNAGGRAILSRGWAGFSARTGANLFLAGPVSHRALFPRCAAIVHHGGAGTTHAAARAGVPQVIVPHAFDQFQFAAWAKEAGVATASLPRTRLAWRPLSERIETAASDRALARNAAALGERMRARDPLGATIALLEEALEGRRARRALA